MLSSLKMNLKVLGRATGMISFARTNKMGELEGGPPSEKDIFFIFFLFERNFRGFAQIFLALCKLEQILGKFGQIRANLNFL